MQMNVTLGPDVGADVSRLIKPNYKNAYAHEGTLRSHASNTGVCGVRCVAEMSLQLLKHLEFEQVRLLGCCAVWGVL
jgi:hypothetical protein